MEEIDNRGGGTQRRFRLKVSLQSINEAVATSRGSFQRFLKICGKPEETK